MDYNRKITFRMVVMRAIYRRLRLVKTLEYVMRNGINDNQYLSNAETKRLEFVIEDMLQLYRAMYTDHQGQGFRTEDIVRVDQAPQPEMRTFWQRKGLSRRLYFNRDTRRTEVYFHKSDRPRPSDLMVVLED